MRRLLILAGLLGAAPCAAQLPAPPPDTLASACAAGGHRQFDFWIGRWSVGPPGRAKASVNEISRVAQGCALREQYHNGQGYTGTSINHFDAAAGTWHQLWIDNAGLILHLDGGLDAAGRMVMSGDRVDARGAHIRDRITWIPQENGTVLQVWDVSTDAGQNWRNLFTGEYVRLADD